MSQPRVVMIWTGGVFVLTGLVLIVLRLIGAHDGLPVVAELGLIPYFGAASGLGVVGLMLVLLAPQDRRKTRRVRLDEAPVHENTTLRPARHQGVPATSGFQEETQVRPAVDPKPKAPATPRPNAPGPAGGATAARAPDHLPDTRGVPGPSSGRSAWGKPRSAASDPPAAPRGHPNSALLEAPELDDMPRSAAPAAPPQQPAGAPPAPHGHGPSFDPAETAARQQSRRIELMSRLEALEQKANQAKVRYGLGKVSAAGYRQYLAEVDRERMMIESELMESEE